jgi:hypothetical protein
MQITKVLLEIILWHNILIMQNHFLYQDVPLIG